VVAETATGAADALEQLSVTSNPAQQNRGEAPSVVFMMPGGGAQYAGMGRQLYEREPVYAYRFPGLWFDIGNPEQLLEADNHWRERVGLPPRETYSTVS